MAGKWPQGRTSEGMPSLCQVVLTLNAIGLLAVVYLLYKFRKPIAVAFTLAQSMMQQHPPVVVEERPSPVVEEGLPPPEEGEQDGDKEAAPPRKRLTFAAEDD